MSRKKNAIKAHSSKRNKNLVIIITALLLLDVLIVPRICLALDVLLIKREFILSIEAMTKTPWKEVVLSVFLNKGVLGIFVVFQVAITGLVVNILFKGRLDMKSKQQYVRIAENIFVPIPRLDSYVFGNARFATTKQFEKNGVTTSWTTKRSVGVVNNKPPSGGVALDIQIIKKKKKEKFMYSTAKTHTLILGATRSGKTRRIYLPSIWKIAQSGENMIISDMKGELYGYTRFYLEKQGYEVFVLDLSNPLLSDKYPVFEPIIQLLSSKETEPMAVNMVDQFVQTLVPHNDKSEPIWENGEKSIIGFSILALCKYAPEENQKTLSNAYYFISEMCTPDANGDIPLNKFVGRLKADLGISLQSAPSRVAPEKTRGSFFTSALATLKVYANPILSTIYQVQYDENGDSTKKIIRFSDFYEKKTAVFMIVPDSDKTYYGIVTLFIQMFYQYVSKQSEKFQVMERTCHILWDENGNFPAVNGYSQMLTIAGGKEIRIVAALQSLGQFQSLYEKDYITIIGNFADWIYLKATDNDTNEDLLKKLGNYDALKESVSKGVNDKDDSSNVSVSTDVISRPLLTMEEILSIQRPYQLVYRSEVTPNIYIASIPELSELQANDDFGMGSEKHNQELLYKRHMTRKEDKPGKVKLWIPDKKEHLLSFATRQKINENSDETASLVSELSEKIKDWIEKLETAKRKKKIMEQVINQCHFDLLKMTGDDVDEIMKITKKEMLAKEEIEKVVLEIAIIESGKQGAVKEMDRF